MNDKRTLLGFLLIGLIFVLAPYYYEWMGISPKPPEPNVEEEVLDGWEREEIEKKESREMVARELQRPSTASSPPPVSKNSRPAIETLSEKTFVSQRN